MYKAEMKDKSSIIKLGLRTMGFGFSDVDLQKVINWIDHVREREAKDKEIGLLEPVRIANCVDGLFSIEKTVKEQTEHLRGSEQE